MSLCFGGHITVPQIIWLSKTTVVPTISARLLLRLTLKRYKPSPYSYVTQWFWAYIYYEIYWDTNYLQGIRNDLAECTGAVQSTYAQGWHCTIQFYTNDWM